MKFSSPWQSAFFRKTVEVLRLLLRPMGNLENRLVEQLTENQNQRVIKYMRKVPPKDLLLIMPRCVKKSGCRADVKSGLDECFHCRQCVLGDVAELCGRYHIQALVAFRSHIAFEMARTHKPDLIIATACHDRLVKALRSVSEYPALLAPLPPMEKMCVNAGVDLVWLNNQLATVCGEAEAAPRAQRAEKSCPLPKAQAAEGP